MFNLSGGEITFILILGLVVLGPEKLPDAIRRGGRIYAELKRMSSGVQSDLKKVIDEPLREFKKTTESARSVFTETADEIDSAVRQIATPKFIPYPEQDDVPEAEVEAETEDNLTSDD